MGYIFISYSHKDKKYVHKLEKALKEKGFDVWIDDRINYGGKWPSVIESSLDACDAFIVVVSENSSESDWVEAEVARATRKKKPIFPLLLNGEPWLSVETRQYSDVSGGKLPSIEFYDDLYKAAPRTRRVTPSGIYNSQQKKPLERTLGLKMVLAILILVIIVLTVSVLSLLNRLSTPIISNPTKIPSTIPSETAIVVTSTPKEQPTGISSSGLSTEMQDDANISMVLIPSGEFTMGRSYGDNQNEEPAHKVFLDDYYIDAFEVTNGAYTVCEDEGICLPPPNLSSPERQNYYKSSNFRDFPVIYVDWDMANTYCEWRDARLPTEAEWEKAARGDNENNKFYPWGIDTDCSFGNFAACNKDTVRVGSYQKGVSPYGVYDMAGNVWEWVADWYGFSYYEISPHNNPKGPDKGEYRVLRGGSWNNPTDEVRVTYRVRYYPFINSFNLGFRCARSVSP